MFGSAALKRHNSVVLVVALLAMSAVIASSGASATGLGRVGRHALALGREASQPGDAGLTSRLAVLRRAQTPADVLPAGVHVAGGGGVIIPGLTRLVASRGGAGVYLAVSTPAAGSPPLWSAKLGDQVGIVTVTGGVWRETFPVPAVDLTNGFAVELVGAGRSRSTHALAGVYEVGIVPDGVARVRWTFANAAATRRYVVDVPAANNVAITPLHTGTPFLLRATWYGSDGSVIPTSDSAMRHAIAARDNVLRERIIRQDARSSFRPSPAILADFAVFNVTSRSGVRIGQLTISRPRLSSVPLPILSLTAPRRHAEFDPGLDPEDMRQATTPSGVRAWIIPGRHGICVAAVDEPQFPNRYGGGGAAGCSVSVAQAESEGAGFSSCCFSGYSWHYGVLPNSHPTLTIRTGPHTRKTIRPPDGVYIYRERQ
jgi:hypothetical protein